MALTITDAESRIVNDGTPEVKYLYQILVDSETDLADTPTDALPGSLAYTADGQSYWMLANDGTWTEYGTVPEEDT